MVPLMIVFELPERTPTLNRLLGMHWSTYHKIAKRYKEMVWAMTLRSKTAISHRVVRITRRSPATLDDDNLRGGCKPILDALKKAQLIVDDSPFWVTVFYVQQKSRSQTTLVEIWEEGDAIPLPSTE